VLKRLLVAPGSGPQLASRDARDALGLEGKTEASERLAALQTEVGELQGRLWAEHERALLVVLQGMDASGKDGVANAVLREVNAAGSRSVPFKAPTEPELDHDFLWRVHAATPGRGELVVFNRSHYEDVVAVRVLGLRPEAVWRRRFGHIRDFERLLADEGTQVVKLFLHLSRDEQRKELQERLDDPAKRWKFRRGDLETRARWDDYAAAYEEAIAETSTEAAPWYVIPADRAWVRNLAAVEVVAETLRRLDPRYPPGEPELEGLVVE